MADAPTIANLSPKELGKHLRDVRRRKGLSQSEVARGAGLTRRELNAYEKGKVPIPDSDLFVLAGSCGVDVTELRLPTPTPELGATTAEADTPSAPAPAAPPSTIEDTVNLLRRSQEVAAPPLEVPSGRRRPRALGAAPATAPAATEPAHAPTPAAPPAPDLPAAEPEWAIEQINPLEAVPWPDDVHLAPPPASAEPTTAEPVDVFEELARLPESPPLPADEAEPDLFRPLPDLVNAPPLDAIEELDGDPYDEWPELDGTDDPVPTERNGEPVLVEMPNGAATFDITSAADAPPIDVAARTDSFVSPWEALQQTRDGGRFDTPTELPDSVYAFDTPPAEEPASTEEWPDQVWPSDPAGFATPATDPSGFDVHEDDGWAPADDEWAFGFGEDGVPSSADVGFDSRFAGDALLEQAPGPWAHEPDPAATSTGFYIDWGDPADELPALPAWDATAPASEPVDPWTEPVDPWTVPVDAAEAADAFAAIVTVERYEPADATPPEEIDESADAEAPDEVEPIFAEREPEPVDDDADLPVISWRPDDAPVREPDPDLGSELDEEPEPDPEPEETFAVAGSEWELGNAVPLVEVRSTGGLVMCRADERWALADVTAARDFALEAYVDFRSGPGFGVLFRAEVDGDGRMSGYSFDVDPVYDGGAYLVREWRADRELWNPIEHVTAPDAEAMHGLLAVRVTVDDDRLVASVNGEVVLTVESLKQASVDRGREGASGNRVGIQAWSSTDLVIDELRVAEH